MAVAEPGRTLADLTRSTEPMWQSRRYVGVNIISEANLLYNFWANSNPTHHYVSWDLETAAKQPEDPAMLMDEGL